MTRIQIEQLPATDGQLRTFQDIAEIVACEEWSYEKCAASPTRATMVKRAWDSLTTERQIIILASLQREALDTAIKYGQLMRLASCG